jgi:hypothetical protein
MSDNADKMKKLRQAVLAQGIADPDGDARLVFTPDKAKPQWAAVPRDKDFTAPKSYLVSYAAQGERWWTIMSPHSGAGLADILNSAVLAGDDVTHVRITRLSLNPLHA